jgi:tetratricopeptide (TPR) repeat protein
VRDLDEGFPYDVLLTTYSQQAGQIGAPGVGAALSEIALRLSNLPPLDEANSRRIRAEWLRQLDQTELYQRESMSEAFPPDERLSLHEAVTEIERALALDPYDAVLWNLKAVWCNQLGRHSEALRCADQAIALSRHYPRPWINKASALWALRRDAEALACAHETLKHTKTGSSEFQHDAEEAGRMIQRYSAPRGEVSLQELVPVMEQIVAAVEIACNQGLKRAVLSQRAAGARACDRKPTEHLLRADDGTTAFGLLPRNRIRCRLSDGFSECLCL